MLNRPNVGQRDLFVDPTDPERELEVARFQKEQAGKDYDGPALAWMAKNPGVYELFLKFAEEAYRAGVKRIGARFIVERIRWQRIVETRGEPFKVNNSYVGTFARLAVKERPHLKEVFEFRKRKYEASNDR